MFIVITCTTLEGSAVTGLSSAATSSAFIVSGEGSYRYQITTIDNAGRSVTTACSALTIGVDLNDPIAANTLSWDEGAQHR